ncbi:MAG: glycoside hydrolase family 31 protein [Bacteroidales bacterium]|nr:glycoside hydrolase family 31 protein [Bacteroidales bacterium]
MKKYLLFFISLLSLPSFAQVKTSYDGFLASVRGVDIKVEFYTPDIVRVFKTVASSDLQQKRDFVVVLDPQSPEVRVQTTTNMVTARSSAIEVKMDLETGCIHFRDLNGKRLLSEKDYGMQIMPVRFVQRIRPTMPQGQSGQKPAGVTPTQSSPGQATPGMNHRRMRIVTEKTNEITQSFILDQDEIIYGLGQHQSGKMNQRGQRLILEQNNMEIAIPYFTSVKGYGLYWDNYSITTFDDTPMGTSFTSEAGEAIDYYFLYGGDGDGTVALFRKLTGQAKLAPLWTFGFWQCKERYKSADEVVEVVQKYRNLQVPLDAIVQDWKYWGEDPSDWNSLGFKNPSFSNYNDMFSSLKKLNAKMMISVWPSIGENTQIYQDLKEMGALYPMQTSPRQAKVYNIWNKAARDHFWSYMDKNMFEPGISAWWLDGPEPEFYNTSQSDFNQPTGEGALRNVRNTYPLFVSKGVYENQRATTEAKRVYILTRSAFAGLQRYGAGSWSGDIRASWDVFKKQIPAGLNFSMCAIPYWNTDIGAWHPYGNVYTTANTDPGYQEIYCRWFQFAAFNPMMRAHGTGSPREIYQFGERGYWAFDVQEQYLNLRYSMLPYIYGTAWQTTKNGYSFLRHMSMEAPKDSNTWNLDDQFMFGQAFLVAPILEDGEGKDKIVNRKVYLPDNSFWIDFWTNETFTGGQTITKSAPIDIIPLFVKAGSVIPFTTQKVQYSTEKKWDRLELRVYPGADGCFTLYEDEFDNYNYENGAYTEIPISWDNANRTLTIGVRNGEYSGMLTSRRFIVTIAGEKVSRTLKYTGKQIHIKL